MRAEDSRRHGQRPRSGRERDPEHDGSTYRARRVGPISAGHRAGGRTRDQLRVFGEDARAVLDGRRLRLGAPPLELLRLDVELKPAFLGVDGYAVALEDHSLRELVRKAPETTSLARRIQGAWIAFARTGDPSHPGLGAWPAYNPSQRATLILDEPPRVEEAPLESSRRFWQELAEA